MKPFLLILTLSVALLQTPAAQGQSAPLLMPQPRSVIARSETFKLDAHSRITYAPDTAEMQQLARHLAQQIDAQTGLLLSCKPVPGGGRENDLHLLLSPAPGGGAEAYTLDIAAHHLHLKSGTVHGLFRGMQTLQQLIAQSAATGEAAPRLQLPGLRIEDAPAFAWRGVLVDAGRHFISVDYLKRLIEVLAHYKINVLHWHLTEDQGWRIEIKKYPRLTSVGAWRTEPDGTRYGGFYTREDIREVVAHARRYHIDVVPEIELPGHCMAALAAYPELSCSGGPFDVQTQWGVFKDVYCAGNEKTFAFLQDVFDEVIALFPGPYIHVGGDEVPKDRWQACPLCQTRIQAENLRDTAELQSYFVQRIEKYLRSKGRRLIGWDEILEGGLAAGATVQSWRGMEGALAAARAGHDAIASPYSHTYFNADIGDTDLRKAYDFQPLPPELEAPFRHHIIGGECCLWSERITEENLTRQLFPRLLALSEVLWTSPAPRDYDDFLKRVRRQYDYLQAIGVAYGPEARPVTVRAEFDALHLRHRITVESGEPGLALHYTLDGQLPTLRAPRYTMPFVTDTTRTIKAAAFREDQPYGEIAERTLSYHAALGALPHLDHPFSPRYSAGGAYGLVDGISGSTAFTDACWQGFEGDDFVATIDLGREMPLQHLACRFLQNTGSWIFLPRTVRYALSGDGTSYQEVATFEHTTAPGTAEVKIIRDAADLSGHSARFLRIAAENVAVCPPWHPGAGGKCWIFIDEIVLQR